MKTLIRIAEALERIADALDHFTNYGIRAYTDRI